MARTKQTYRKSSGGIAPRKQLATMAACRSASQSISTEPATTIITDSPWYYTLTPHPDVQGPFDRILMRQWLEAGYFEEGGDLRISQDPKGQFRALSSIFPDISVAFKTNEHGPSQKESAEKVDAVNEA